MAQRATLQLPSLPATVEYSIDAWQRSILFLDVLRRRAAQAEGHAAQTAPHVLDYEAELVLDGRSLERPVNYALVRIIPSEGVDIDPLKRRFVVVDPRAGHGPGIGGFEADSEIGVAMKAGHPCCFVGFLPDPVPGFVHWEARGRASARAFDAARVHAAYRDPRAHSSQEPELC